MVERRTKVRFRDLSRLVVQAPGGRPVCTSSLSAVTTVPSCRVTAFSVGSWRPAASPVRGEEGGGVLVREPDRDASVPSSLH